MMYLPSRWVYIHTPRKKENVANVGGLTQAQADSFRRYWMQKYPVITKVTLETDDGKVLKEYNY